MKILRNIIEIDEELCDGCGLCVPACDEGAIQIINGKAKTVAEKYCDGLGACLGDCPQGAITMVERLADDFDPEAVEEYLKERNSESSAPAAAKTENSSAATLACGCPSTQLQTLTTCNCNDSQKISGTPVSALGHWPVQIRLIPAHAPFLNHADILILADCAAVAYAGLHQELLKNRVVMMGCPKFDNLPDYEERFTEMFTKNEIKSVTVVTMEVPCCSGLPVAVKKALQKAGKNVPVKEMVIGLKGEILK
ncbi:MAG: 4Fe-4S binding protein [Deltaproteobacteria bacterium]|nr:4Fe-4S binding protein [Deltaproteobacteria bacterium]